MASGSDPGWEWYVARSGDYLALIAQERGCHPMDIWKHPANAPHRAKRGSPDILYPGDELFVPSIYPTPPPPPAPPAPPPLPPPPPPTFHVVCMGEHVPLLAERYGFDAESTWNAPDNADLRAKREGPFDVRPGDVLAFDGRPPLSQLCTARAMNVYQVTQHKFEVTVTFESWVLPPSGPCLVSTDVAPVPREESLVGGKLALQLPWLARYLLLYFPDDLVDLRQPLVHVGRTNDWRLRVKTKLHG